jgi:hypothetical protein
MTLAQSLVLYNFDMGFDFAMTAYAQQKYISSLDILGNIVNSKYLHITDHKYVQGKLGYDTITGTIVNNAAKNISSATVYAALYDKNILLSQWKVVLSLFLYLTQVASRHLQ